MGWSEFERVFGGLVPTANTAYAVHGYFDNGGEIAWMVRAGGGTNATATWDVSSLAGFAVDEYGVVATSPGSWGNAVTVTFVYRSGGVAGAPELDIRVSSIGEPTEVFASVPPDDVEERLAASVYVQLVRPALPRPPGPSSRPRRSRSWVLRLAGGTDAPPDAQDYLGAVTGLAGQPEVALDGRTRPRRAPGRCGPRAGRGHAARPGGRTARPACRAGPATRRVGRQRRGRVGAGAPA